MLSFPGVSEFPPACSALGNFLFSPLPPQPVHPEGLGEPWWQPQEGPTSPRPRELGVTLMGPQAVRFVMASITCSWCEHGGLAWCRIARVPPLGGLFVFRI